MKRELQRLATEEFDLLVIGGGIYGATVAWDAVLRGLRVALIEKNDFASGTSANSLKIIHGGLRYLQHADLIRMRESIAERRSLLRIAPHLVFPLPCIMPTFGHAVKGPEVMRIGLLMNDLFSADRNRGLDAAHKLPHGRIVSKRQVQQLIPGVNRDDLNGGALWYDAHMINAERLLFSFLHGAVEKGATAANYVKAEKLLVKNRRVCGVLARDLVGENSFEISAKMTITALGPWINDLLADHCHAEKKIEFSTAMNLVINRQLTDIAFAAPSKKEFKDSDALINKGSRLLFFVPWRGKTLAGTAHKPYRGDADEYAVTETEICEFLDEVNGALPNEKIRRDEIVHVYAGLLPMSGVNKETGDVTITKHFEIIDHKEKDDLDGLLSILTVKFTTARGVAEAAVTKAVNKLGYGDKCSRSRDVPIWGGDMRSFEEFRSKSMANLNGDFSPESKKHLIHTFGTRYQDVLNCAEDGEKWALLCSDSYVLKAEVIFGIRYEMAQTLSDILLRRTELGTAGRASDAQISAAVALMAHELNWTPTRQRQEIINYEKTYNYK
ncbi:glycerol-3-phosphate dehydrogenase/oxidase [candidate division KSB1 bacterium]|nr:glycerol-3-phosphate dehydrogenase/oxidase [candidate division KSB1 bacterium]